MVLTRTHAVALSAKQVQALVEGTGFNTGKSYVRKMGFEFFADLHVIVDGTISVREGHAIAHAVKTTIIHAKPAVYNVLVHIEPAT